MRKLLLLLAAAGCTVFLSAQTLPTVSFSFTVDPNTNSVNFANGSHNLGEGIKKAYWSFGDGSRAVTGPTEGVVHRYAAAGTYQACLKVYRYPLNSHDSVLLGSACKSVIIERACSAGFEWLNITEGSSPTRAVRFSAFAHSNAGKAVREVCWRFGDGTDTCITVPAGTEPNAALKVTHKYREGGSYYACIRVVFDGGCVAEKCSQVAVPKIQPAPDSCAAGFSVQPLTATPLGRKFIAQPWSNKQKKPVRICWKFGDGKDTCMEYSTSYTGDYRVEHRYERGGQYEACVSIRYDGGCESRKCNVVAISQAPPDGCEASVNQVAADQASLERRFYAGLQTNRQAEKICWKFGDGTDTCVMLSSPLNPQQLMVAHRYAAPGNYNVCIRVVYAGGCVAERCRLVEIRIPHNNICGGYITDSAVAANTIRFSATSIHGPDDEVTSYLWTFGDGTSSRDKVVKHVFAEPGTYTVCLTINTRSGCETRICKRIAVAGDVQPRLFLAPNPVVNTLTAVFQSLWQQTVSVRIYNSNGVLIKSYSRSAAVGTNTWTFDLGGLQAGIYSMVVQSANQFATAIFFKQ